MPSASAPGPAGPSPFPLRSAPAPLPPGQAENSPLPLLPPRRRVSPFSSPFYSVSSQTRDICQEPALSLLKASFAASESGQKTSRHPSKIKKKKTKKSSINKRRRKNPKKETGSYFRVATVLQVTSLAQELQSRGCRGQRLRFASASPRGGRRGPERRSPKAPRSLARPRECSPRPPFPSGPHGA